MKGFHPDTPVLVNGRVYALKIITLGTIAKQNPSLKESNSLPRSLIWLVFRATYPSSKSKKILKNTKIDAALNASVMIAVISAQKPKKVPISVK